MNNMKMDSNSHGSMMHGDSMMHMGNLRQKFWLSLILAVPILFLSPAMGIHLPFQFQFPGSDFIVVVFATALFFYGGSPFLKGAKSELKHHRPEMMTLISLGITVSYIYSLYAFFANNIFHSETMVMDFFWELATLILIMLLGHWLEMKTMMKAQSSVSDLASLLPDKVHLQQKGKIKDVALNQVTAGEHFEVRSGEAIPLDGKVIDGQSSVNESLVTGESQSVSKKIGDQVIGGSVNGEQTLIVQATQTLKTGFLANVEHLVQESQNNKSHLQSLADKVAGWLFYAALIIGLISLIVWASLIDFATGLQRMVTVLVIACPHALGLAIPLVNARSTTLGSKNGLLIRHRQVIDTSLKIDYVLLDKTGTLTEGKFQVRECHSVNSQFSDQKVLQIIAALEAHSNHPIAKSVQQYWQKHNSSALTAEKITTIAGQGLKGQIAGKEYQLLNAKAVQENGIKLPEIQDPTLTTSYLITDSQVQGYLSIGDQIKDSTAELINKLKEHNIKPMMLTGDNQIVAAKLAQQLKLTEFKADLLPKDKQTEILKLQAAGHQVMMVGDGINDAPSLSQANIGVAIGAGTDVAIDSADVVLVNSNPLDILKFLNLAKNTHRKTIQNLWWGAGYNIIALPLASGLFAFAGIVLSPALGAILMSLSTVVVAVNALFLKI